MVPQKEKKDYSFLVNIFELCLECVDKGVIPTPEVGGGGSVKYLTVFTCFLSSIRLIRKPSGKENMALIRFFIFLKLYFNCTHDMIGRADQATCDQDEKIWQQSVK